MKKHIALLIILFATERTECMMHKTNEENISAHLKISKQAAQLIQSDINATTIDKWKEILEQAKKFKEANPNFPYLHLARRAGQGPDAQSIITAAPIVIDILEHKCVEQNKLKKIEYNFGKEYLVKLITAPKR